MRYPRRIVVGGLLLLVALTWWFLIAGAGMPDMHMAMADMPPPPLQALILMWWLMMVAMMVPSAAPAVLLYGRIRQVRGSGAGIGDTWFFLAGYLLAWLLFSIVAALAQRYLAGSSMQFTPPAAQAAVLVAAGVYQLTPVKSACLRQCQAPAHFISRHWRPRAPGAVRLGLLHGAYCVGCCWLLMALLFVGGVMNFVWIATLAVIVAIEKLVPYGEWLGRATGVALIMWGAARLAGAA